MNEDALSPADASRRDVLLGGLTATVAAGLPAAAVAQTNRQQDLLSPDTSTGTKTMNSITTKDGVEIYFKDWGPRSAQPIVFHHGWPLSGDDWDTQLLYFLGKGYRVVAHDRRGHGRSAQVSDGHDMDHYAADAAAVVEHLDLRNAVHIGHSTGGGEATHYVAQHGQRNGRVAKLVLVGAVPPIMVKTPANPGGCRSRCSTACEWRSPATERSSIAILRAVPSTASTGQARSRSPASFRTGGGRP
jgi:non-heme chloroperoxidase